VTSISMRIDTVSALLELLTLLGGDSPGLARFLVSRAVSNILSPSRL